MTTETRVYSYHAWPPHHNADAVRDQLYNAQRYYNALLQQHNKNNFHSVRARYFPALAQLEAEISVLNEQIDEAGGRRKAPKTLLTQRSALNAKCKPWRKAAKEALAPGEQEEKRRIAAWCKERGLQAAPHNIRHARGAVLPSMLIEPQWSDYWKEEAQRCECDRKARRVSDDGLRSTCGVESGTYTAVEAAVAQALKMSKFGPPEPKCLTGEGKLGVQIQGGLALPDTGPFELTNGFIEIDPLPEDQWKTRSGRRHAQTRVRIRIGSEVRKGSNTKVPQPVWAEFNIILHRRPVGVLTWAYIMATRVGTRMHYELQLTVNRPITKPEPSTNLVAAINLGWRGKRDGSMRVAYLVDSAGHEEELILTEEQRSAITYADDIRQLEAFYFNRVRGELARWLRRNRKSVGPQLKDRTVNIGKWRSQKKLARAAMTLVHQEFPTWASVVYWWETWKTERLERDADLLAPFATVNSWLIAHGLDDPNKRMAIYCDWWRRKNRHLYQIESGRRAHGQHARREVYRLWGKMLCERYALILVDDSELAELAKRPPKGTERTRAEKEAAHNRFVASCYGIKLAINSASRSGQIGQGDGHGCTQRCTRCDRPAREGNPHDIVVVCPCGHYEDRDARFCHNVLKKAGCSNQAA